jgi:hypothetical protein
MLMNVALVFAMGCDLGMVDGTVTCIGLRCSGMQLIVVVAVHTFVNTMKGNIPDKVRAQKHQSDGPIDDRMTRIHVHSSSKVIEYHCRSTGLDKMICTNNGTILI